MCVEVGGGTHTSSFECHAYIEILLSALHNIIEGGGGGSSPINCQVR